MSHWRLRFPTDPLLGAGLESLLLLWLLLVAGSCTEIVDFLTYQEVRCTVISVLSNHLLFNSRLMKFNSSLLWVLKGH